MSLSKVPVTKVRVAIIAVIVIAVIAGLAYYFTRPTAPAAPASIKVGAVIPLTGKYGTGGAQVKAGYEYMVEVINKQGGVYVKEFGKRIPIELIVRDDESDPTKTVSRLEELYAAGVVAYLGGFGSDLHAAAASIAEKNKVPYLGVAFALYKVHQQGFKYLFSPFWKSPDSVAIFDLLSKAVPPAQRPTKIAIFQELTDWGKEIAAYWKEAAPKYGYEAVVYEYAPGTKDFSDIISKAKAAGADAVFAVPSTPDGITMFKQMRELDFNAKLYFIIRAPDPVAWYETLGTTGDYVVFCPGWHNGVPFPGVKELNEWHEAKFGRPADVMVGPAAACVQILANAIERAGKLDRDAIRDAIATTDMMTVIGPVSFRPDGTGKVITFLDQWQGGKQQLVYPLEYATAPFIYPAKPWAERG
jgi:branched-chain amino acid transport system substrate-binding protein